MSFKAFSSSHYFDATIAAMTHPLTVCIWVKKNATEWAASSDDTAGMLSDNFTDDNEAIEMYTRADTFRAHWNEGASSESNSTKTFTDGDYDDIWVPLITKYTSATSYIVYVENVAGAGNLQTTSRDLMDLDSFRLGERSGLNIPFEGKIAEVTLWDKSLSDAEINQINPTAETGPAGNTIASANCVGYWPLDTDSDTQVDESGTANGSLVATGTRVYDSDHPTITTATGNPWNYYAQQQIG